jgi:hypothetical protein
MTTDVSAELVCGRLIFQLTTSKCILGWRSSIVGNLDPPTLAHGVVVEIDIGALIKSVVRGLLGWWGEVVMDVCEAVI